MTPIAQNGVMRFALWCGRASDSDLDRAACRMALGHPWLRRIARAERRRRARVAR